MDLASAVADGGPLCTGAALRDAVEPHDVLVHVAIRGSHEALCLLDELAGRGRRKVRGDDEVLRDLDGHADAAADPGGAEDDAKAAKDGRYRSVWREVGEAERLDVSGPLAGGRVADTELSHQRAARLRLVDGRDKGIDRVTLDAIAP